MMRDLCAGTWTVDRAMVEPSTWLAIPYGDDDCEVTTRMVDPLRVVLTAIHKAGASRPVVWRGPGGIVVDWRCAWPFGTVHGDSFRRVCIDVEDEPDECGAIGCVMLEAHRDTSCAAAIEGWSLDNLDHIAAVVAGFLHGESLARVAEQLPKCVGEASRPWACSEFASGPYTCRTDANRWRHDSPPTLPGGVCAEAP